MPKGTIPAGLIYDTDLTKGVFSGTIGSLTGSTKLSASGGVAPLTVSEKGLEAQKSEPAPQPKKAGSKPPKTSAPE
ncbi:MAG: hypothetical protein ACHQ50_18190 [Fimbriimonadales bacterium]